MDETDALGAALTDYIASVQETIAAAVEATIKAAVEEALAEQAVKMKALRDQLDVATVALNAARKSGISVRSSEAVIANG